MIPDALSRLWPFGESGEDSEESANQDGDAGGFVRSRLDASVMFGHGLSTREVSAESDDEHTEQLESVQHERE